MSSTWKERALKKKKYRRGGLEPDPPKKRHKSKKKQFILQHYDKKWNYSLTWLDGKWGWHRPDEYEWQNYGKFVKLEDAVKSGEDNSTRGLYKEKPWRILNLKTKEVLWEAGKTT